MGLSLPKALNQRKNKRDCVFRGGEEEKWLSAELYGQGVDQEMFRYCLISTFSVKCTP